MSTSLIAHRTANAFSVICFLLLLLVGLDILLPRIVRQETVQGNWREVYRVRNKYSGGYKEVKDDEREYLVTETQNIAVDLFQHFSCEQGDVVEISATPLFGFVREVHLLKDGEKKIFERDSSLLGNFIFLPYALLFTSAIGLINYKNPEQSINFASGSLVLLGIILWMMKIF